MSKLASEFIARSTAKAADIEHREKIKFNIGKYNAVVPDKMYLAYLCLVLLLHCEWPQCFRGTDITTNGVIVVTKSKIEKQAGLHHPSQAIFGKCRFDHM